MSVARACGDDDPAASDAAAAAIELLHCASLVHDDLPCFDDAPLRRGQPSVHAAFGEPLAVLAGDALIVSAFETLARGAARSPKRLAALVGLVARAAGSPAGIAAGQAWESEPNVALTEYQQAKTGALFAAATVTGAAAAGAPSLPWRLLGECLGEAYQVADDLRDVACRQEEVGKPVGRDSTLGRPNAAALLGMGGALARLRRLVREAIEVIPDCPGAETLRAEIEAQTRLFLPASLARELA
ncbi:geranylgeranyl diphosphate synthase type II [Methylobacterium goesingense]|uniref:Geranylgeranyl diphosphate synthase type II n=1 Tax=Methylobacterium goesingense TaxID=243690 RepID=A0ABV2L6L5_9HYPH